MVGSTLEIICDEEPARQIALAAPGMPAGCRQDADRTLFGIRAMMTSMKSFADRRAVLRWTAFVALLTLASCSDAIPPQGFGETFQNLYVTSPDSQTWRALDADVS